MNRRGNKVRSQHNDFIDAAWQLYRFLVSLNEVTGVAPCKIIPGHGTGSGISTIKIVSESGCIRTKVTQSDKFQYLQIYSSNCEKVKESILEFVKKSKKFKFL